MDFFEDIAPWFWGLWFITIPLSIYIVYTIITELLDLIFNTGKINELLKHSDNLNFEPWEEQYKYDKTKQSKLSSSNLKELERQMNYSRLQTKKSNWRYYRKSQERDKIITAKNLSDIFRTK